MTKISLLTPEYDLDGNEQVVMVKDGVTRRAAVSGLVGAAVAPHVQAAELAASTALAASNYFGIAQYGTIAAAIAAGEAGTELGRLFSVDDGAGNLVFRARIVGGSIEVARTITPSALADIGGSSLIGVAGGGRLTDAMAAVTPEQFLAQGNAQDYHLRNDVADDTDEIQAAIMSGAGMIQLKGAYMVSSLVVPWPVTFEGGTLYKKRGVNGRVFQVNAHNVTIRGTRIIQFNGSFTASVAGTTMIVTGDVVGVIRHDAANNRGAMLDALGLTPGTRVTDGPPEGGPGVYTINKPHDLSARTFRFTDAPAFYQANDSIYTERDDLIVERVALDGSAGGGIGCIGGARLRVDKFNIRNVHDNGIQVACSGELVGADNPTISNGIVNGTGTQNGVFFTASAGSVSTANYLYGVAVNNVSSLNCGDTALELGIHVQGSTVTNCILGPSKNPPLLCRDARDFVCSDIILVPPPEAEQNADWAAAAVVSQTEGADWNCNGTFARLKFFGRARRAFAFINQSGVTVRDCDGIDGAAAEDDGSDLLGSFVALANSVSNITIKNNSARGWARGVFFNFGASPVNLDRITIEGNEFRDMDTVVDIFNVTLTNSRSVGNTIQGVLSRAYNVASATLTPSNGLPALICDDAIKLAGFTGATPKIFNPTTAPMNGVAIYRETTTMVLPENQYSAISLGDMSDLGERTIQLSIPAASQVATFAISGMLGTVTKLNGTSDLLDTSGKEGFEDWALFPADGELILQRRGPNTGLAGRWLYVSRR